MPNITGIQSRSAYTVKDQMSDRWSIDDSTSSFRRDSSLSFDDSLLSGSASFTRFNDVIGEPSKEDLNRLMKDFVFVDYFNVFLNLPIFPQRILYDMTDNEFTFDPPVLFGNKDNTIPTQLLSSLGNWILQKRYPHFLQSGIFWEYLLCVDLLCPQPFDKSDKFTALSCSRFVYEKLGNVIGMRQFKANLQTTPGFAIFKALKEIDKFLRLAPTQSDRLSKYRQLRTKVLARTPTDKDIYFPYDEIYDEYDIDIELLETLRHVLFFTLKIYWLPRYLIHCCPANSKRRVCLEKEIRHCRKMVGKHLLEFPSLTKYQLMQFCYDSVLPAKRDQSGSPKHSTKPASLLPPIQPHKSAGSVLQRSAFKRRELPGAQAVQKDVCLSQAKPSRATIVNKMFPTKDTNQGPPRSGPHKDLCLCILSRGQCTCNDNIAFTEDDVLYEHVSELSINNLKCISSKERLDLTVTPRSKVAYQPSPPLSAAAKKLFADIDQLKSEKNKQKKTITAESKIAPPVIRSDPQISMGSEHSLVVSDFGDLSDEGSTMSFCSSINSVRSAHVVHSRYRTRCKSHAYGAVLARKLVKKPEITHVVQKLTKNIRWDGVGQSILKWSESVKKKSSKKEPTSALQSLRKKVLVVHRLRILANGLPTVIRSEETRKRSRPYRSALRMTKSYSRPAHHNIHFAENLISTRSMSQTFISERESCEFQESVDFSQRSVVVDPNGQELSEKIGFDSPPFSRPSMYQLSKAANAQVSLSKEPGTAQSSSQMNSVPQRKKPLTAVRKKSSGKDKSKMKSKEETDKRTERQLSQQSSVKLKKKFPSYKRTSNNDSVGGTASDSFITDYLFSAPSSPSNYKHHSIPRISDSNSQAVLQSINIVFTLQQGARKWMKSADMTDANSNVRALGLTAGIKPSTEEDNHGEEIGSVSGTTIMLRSSRSSKPQLPKDGRGNVSMKKSNAKSKWGRLLGVSKVFKASSAGANASKSLPNRSFKRYSLTGVHAGSTQRNRFTLMAVPGVDHMYVVTDEDKKRFAEFDGQLTDFKVVLPKDEGDAEMQANSKKIKKVVDKKKWSINNKVASKSRRQTALSAKAGQQLSDCLTDTEKKLVRAKANVKYIGEMKELHPTDSLLKDIDLKANTTSTLLKSDMKKEFFTPLTPNTVKYRQWKPKTAKGDKLPNIYQPKSSKVTGINDPPEYHKKVKHQQDTAYKTKKIDPKSRCPVRPDVPAIERDIKSSTDARWAAGEALPVVPGTTHISKVAFPVAPNFTLSNYIIQRYDTISPQAYRTYHQIYLLCMNSDRYAGSPFLTYLEERGENSLKSNYMFWRDAEVFLMETLKGETPDQTRLRIAKELILNYLLPTSTHRIDTINREMKELLIYSLQLDEADEILKYCQDCAIETCRSLWKSYIKHDKINFDQYLKLKDLHTNIEATKLIEPNKNTDTLPVSMVSRDISMLPSIMTSSTQDKQCYQLLLSAEPDALKMLGNNKNFETYFKTETKKGRKADAGWTWLVPCAGNTGLVCLDTSTMNAAYELAISTEIQQTERKNWLSNDGGIEGKTYFRSCRWIGNNRPHSKQSDFKSTSGIKRTKEDRLKSSIRLLVDQSKQKEIHILSSSVKKAIGLEAAKPVNELRIARYDIEESYSSNKLSTLTGKKSMQISPVSHSPSSLISRKTLTSTRKLSKVKVVSYMEPIQKGGRWIERPKRKPLSLQFVLDDEVYRDFFLKFLEYYVAGGPLKLWMDCRDVLRTKSKHNKRNKLEALNALHFKNSSTEDDVVFLNEQVTKYGVDDHFFRDLIKAQKVDMHQLPALMDILYRYLQDKWFKEFRDTFEGVSDEGVAFSIKARATMASWRRAVWTIIDFYRSIKVSSIRTRFLTFIKHDNEKAAQKAAPKHQSVVPAISKLGVSQADTPPATTTAGGGLAPGVVRKASHLAGPGRHSVSGGSSATVKDKGKAPQERDRNKICNEVLFLLEGSRYFRVVRNVKANERASLLPREDFIYAKAKSKAIIDRFFDSDVAPRNQLNIPQSTADLIIRTNKITTADIRLFIDAEMIVLFPVLTLWKRFLKSYWINCSYSQVLPHNTPSTNEYPFHDTVKFEHVMVNSSGEAETARILTSIEGGIRQYLFHRRSQFFSKGPNSLHTVFQSFATPRYTLGIHGRGKITSITGEDDPAVTGIGSK